VDVDAFGDVLGRARGTLARLVVGVRVHVHEAQRRRHGDHPRMAGMTDLQQRYRGPSRAHRAVALVAIVAMVVSGVGVLGWSVFAHSTPEVTSRLTAFEIVDEHQVTADIEVARESQFTEASCRLRAVAEDHTVVGEVEVPVVDGADRRALRVPIRTERRATGVELVGCTTPDQPRPR
jgi:hypothetical protein